MTEGDAMVRESVDIGTLSQVKTSQLRCLSLSPVFGRDRLPAVWLSSLFSSQALLDSALRAQLIALGLSPGAGTVEGSDTTLGVNLGGGIEDFVSRQIAVAGDFRYHGAGDIVAIVLFEGSFFTLSAGFKRYF